MMTSVQTFKPDMAKVSAEGSVFAKIEAESTPVVYEDFSSLERTCERSSSSPHSNRVCGRQLKKDGRGGLIDDTCYCFGCFQKEVIHRGKGGLPLGNIIFLYDEEKRQRELQRIDKERRRGERMQQKEKISLRVLKVKQAPSPSIDSSISDDPHHDEKQNEEKDEDEEQEENQEGDEARFEY